MKPFKLEDEPKIKSGFKVPGNYFEDFASKLVQNLPKEETQNETKVISIFRKRKTILLAIAAVLIIGLMIPILYTTTSKNKELDAATLETYLSEEGSPSQYDLIVEIEPIESAQIKNTNELEAETIEDILVTNPNIENLVIERY
jgi:hypothetical protein